jgi:hypothetical protein
MPEVLQNSTAHNSHFNSLAGEKPNVANGWTSYIDESTGQLYWHNIHTGEVQWDY